MAFKPNFIWYLLIVGVLALVITPIGLAFFGIAILSTAIVGVLIMYFLPAILIGAAIAIMLGFVPMPKFEYRVIGALVCLFLAWALWNGVI